MNPEQIVYDSIREVDEDEIYPFPFDGFFSYVTADPPGSERVRWFPTFEEAVENLRDDDAQRDIRASGGGYSDQTPEGSIGNLGFGVFTNDDMPRWMLKIARKSRT